jgi:conjugative transfer signal peptidase TraF
VTRPWRAPPPAPRLGTDGRPRPPRRLTLKNRWLVAAAAGLGFALGAALFGCRINWSGSLPFGIYRLRHEPGRRGDLVLVCAPPAAERLAVGRHYLGRGSCPGGGAPLGKRIVGAAGDLVTVTASGIRINGRELPSSRLCARDTQGRPLPWCRFDRRLGAEELWLFSPHPRSFDSRYFGPARRRAVRGTLLAWWTLPAASAPPCP